ncbi:MAG: diguanylate cyclase [Candidatus Omnitrophica bacterium]|nr:diguanylate cyclase [Candidatus Omnitrophota bacterium]
MKMGIVSKRKKSYTLQMTIRCISFLGLLAALAFADFYILNDQIKTHKFDAVLINIAGRQRLLFERTALLARYLVNTPDKRERANVRRQLLEAIDLLDDYQEMLIKGSPTPGFWGNPPPAIYDLYFNPPALLKTRMQNYLIQLRVLAATRDVDLKLDDARLISIRTVASGKILKMLDAVVNEYQKESEAKIAKAQKLQRWVVESTLLALLVLGIYLFQPMIRHVRREMDNMEDLNQVLEKQIQEQKTAQEALRKAVKDLADSNQQLDQVGTELRGVNARLEKLALLDPLTELLNRRGLQKVLTTELQRLNRDHSDLSAILLDLDEFKQINDTLGYPVGDIVLKEVATRLKDGLRVTDHVARIGGDEFMILLPDSRRAEAMRVAEKIRFSISENPILLSSGKEVKVTSCLGLIEVSMDISAIDELLSQINPMLHISKKSGKNRISHDGKDWNEGQTLEPGFRARFDAAIQDHGLYALRQPIFNLADFTTFGYEFLSRSSIAGFEMPDDFFRICLEANMLTLIDHKCFRNCVIAGSSLPAGMHRHLNLFPSTIINIPIENLIEVIPPQDLNGTYCIEISEQQIIGDPSYLIEPIRELKRANILIGIDDVGFGRSCLESLILLEPHIIKIDKKCVKGIARDSAHSRALKKILRVSEALGTEIIAEGIESHEDLDMLRDLGVKYGQGFLLGEPAQCAIGNGL